MKKLFIFLGVLLLVCGCGKYDDKDLGLKNPFGTNVTTYNISYLGNNIKGKRD